MHQHHLRRVVRAVVSTAICVSTAITLLAQTPADNTKVNSRDRAKGEVTADQQKENVTVVVQDGQVTLKAPVRSADEKRVVEAKAAAIVGAAHVTNEISIAPAKPAKQ